MGTLYLDVGTDDIVRIGENLAFTIERKSGSRARIRFVGSEKVDMVRHGRSLEEAARQEEAANDRR